MASLLIKNIPEGIRKKLKEEADLHHRSMNKEAVALLEQALFSRPGLASLPPPFKAKVRFTSDWVTKAKKWGRR
jgi:hypothetical protein